jgi:hypothetical protein
MAKQPPPDASRLSPAELRRRLLAVPTDEPPAAPPAAEAEHQHESAPPPLPRPAAAPTEPDEDAAAPTEPDEDTAAIEAVAARRYAMITHLPSPPQAPNPAIRPPGGSHSGGSHSGGSHSGGSHSGGSHSGMGGSHSGMGGSHSGLASPNGAVRHAAAFPSSELAQLRDENAQLHQVIAETKDLLEEAARQETAYQEREKQLQDESADKTRQITELHEHLRVIEEQIAAAEPPKPKTPTELEEWADELEKENARLSQERKQLDEERRQLREDESALEQQMRDMELSMARERAMMARQETELKRLSAEIQHELEVAQRGDAALREQMQKFQRRHQEVLSRSAGLSPPPEPPSKGYPRHGR